MVIYESHYLGSKPFKYHQINKLSKVSSHVFEIALSNAASIIEFKKYVKKVMLDLESFEVREI